MTDYSYSNLPGRKLDAGDILTKNLKLFKQRNALYQDNFRMVGKVMLALFPDGPPKLETEQDYDRWHLFELGIVKLTRYAVHYNNGGHEDSVDDMIVYMSMVAALDKEYKEERAAQENGQLLAEAESGQPRHHLSGATNA